MFGGTLVRFVSSALVVEIIVFEKVLATLALISIPSVLTVYSLWLTDPYSKQYYCHLWVGDEISIRPLTKAMVRHHRALFGESLHVLCFLGQEALRDQKRKIRVVHAFVLDALRNK